MFDLLNRKLLICGGGSGIGQAAAAEALRLGAQVSVVDIEQAALDALSGDFLTIRANACEPAAVAEAIDQSDREMGGLDGVMTCVGGAVIKPFLELDHDLWDREIQFNLTSAYLVASAALKRMQGRPHAAIVLTSSGMALLPAVDRVPYAVAKAGVLALTRSIAAAGAPLRVRVNCIAPGPTDTPRFREMNGGEVGVEALRKKIPLGTIPLPIDCARAALFLLSSAASQITGQTIHVNGGAVMP